MFLVFLLLCCSGSGSGSGCPLTLLTLRSSLCPSLFASLFPSLPQMVLVTEPILGSLRNLQTRFDAVPGASTESKQVGQRFFGGHEED